MEKKPIFIVYASEGGNAKGLAEDFAKRCSDLSVVCQLMTLNAFSEQGFAKSKAIFFVSTTGSGDLPTNGRLFVENTRLQHQDLNSLEYALFALGNPSYSQFCGAGKRLNEILSQAEASSLIGPVFSGEDFLELYVGWALNVLSVLSGLTADELEDCLAEFAKKPEQSYQLVQRVCLSRSEAERSSYHLVLETDQEPLNYQMGDVVSIKPANPEDRVDDLLSYLQLNPEESCQYLGENLSVKSLLLHRVEISKVSVDTIKKTGALLNDWALLAKASDVKEIESFQQQYDLYAWLKAYPLPKESVLDLLMALPKKTSRSYSVASDPLTSANQIHLTVALQAQQFEDKSYFGLGSGALCHQMALGEAVNVSLESHSNFRLNTKTPMVWVAVGTGIAPFIGFLNHLAGLFPDDRPKVKLFYGVRSQEDYLYRDFLQACAEQGLIDLNVCFSRSSKPKQYVQHLMLEQLADVSDLIEKAGHVYVCGSEPMWQEVEALLQHAVVQVREGLEEARVYWNQFSETRLHKEIY